MHYSTTYASPVGLLTLASDGDNLTGLWIEGQKYFKGSITEAMMEKADIPVFAKAREWLDSYFAGELPDTSERLGAGERLDTGERFDVGGQPDTGGRPDAGEHPGAGERPDTGGHPGTCSLPLVPSGSLFRRRVWDILRGIPYGELVTYGDIAAQLGTSARAVGGAVGHNPISIIIPCHRVIGANGNLTGYAGGIDVKIKLLELEGIDTSKLKLR
jgi:methylated-DNA-[protein]-cysteine S-methyltransferase